MILLLANNLFLTFEFNLKTEKMKKIVLGLLMSILIISCVSNTKKTDNGYCKELDTIYKDNSTDIESITRTFYFLGDKVNDFFKVSQEIGKNDYAITIHRGKDFGTIILNKKAFELFIENSKTIIKNKGKDLKYDIGNLKNSSMSASVMVDNGINIYCDNLYGEPVSYELSIDDINNLEKAFNKFNLEK
jgi:hypothetical protein